VALNRREFGKALGAGTLIAGLGLPVCAVQAQSLDLGNGGRVTTFSDGTMRLPVGMLYSNAPKAELDTILAAQKITGDILPRPLNVVLYEDEGRKILFDAGSGTNFLSGLGELPAALDAAGVDVATITDIVFTHAHPDHIWGIMDDFDDLLFPDASFHMSQAECDFWDSDDALAAMPAGRENFAVGAKTRLELIRDQVTLFDFGAEILPAIEAVDSRGHTPGHAAFILHGWERPVMVLGDALTHPVISFNHPDWPNDSDMDPEEAAATRIKLLDRIAADGMLISGYHLPAPGLGMAEKRGGKWHYQQI